MIKKKFTVNCCLLILLCIMLGGILVTVANYLPINSLNKTASLEQIASEGLFPQVPSLQGGYGDFHSMDPTALELATDSLMLKMTLYEGPEAGITQAFRCYSTQYEEEYSRYWHGYVVILRLLLLFFDYYEIRILNMICQGFLFAVTAFYLWRDYGKKYALALASSYLLLMPMALAQCLQYSWVFYVAFLALFLYIKHRTFWEIDHRYLYFFMVVGAVTIFLDLLTYPLLTWGLLITWVIILQEKHEPVVGYIKKVVFSGIAWITGYAGMWIGKWAIGSLVLHKNLFKKAISEALLWTVNEGDASITLQDRLNAIVTNWSTYDYKFYLILLLAWLLYWIIRGLLSGCTKSLKAPALMLICCSSIVWYLLLAGHSIMHHIFTHRTFSVSIAAFLGMILLSTDNSSLHTRSRKHFAGYIITLIAISALSVCFMLQVKDDFSRHNGGPNFTNTQLAAPASMSFTPAYSKITLLSMGFSCANTTKGYCRVQVSDQDLVVEELLLPLADYTEGNFHEIPVKWTLKANHPYTLTIEPIDNDGEFYLWFTSDRTMPLPEYGEIMSGAEQIPGQMLAGFTYWCVLTEASRRLLFTASFMGIFMMLIYVSLSVKSSPDRHTSNKNPSDF